VSIDEYLHDFVQEMQTLERECVYIQNQGQDWPIHVCISSVICDAPARACIIL